MKRAAVFGLCLMASLAAAQEAPQPAGKGEAAPQAADPNWRKVREFSGKVIEISTANREFREQNGKLQRVIVYDGKLTIIGPDPMWILKVAAGGGKPEELVYAIHSPVQLFYIPAEDAVGKVFEFTEYEWIGAAPKLTNRLEAKPAKGGK